MKKIIAVMLVLLAGVVATSAQSLKNEEVAVTFVTHTSNVKLEVPNVNDLGFGGKVSYAHKIKNFAVGGEVGATFNTNGNLDLVRGQYFVKLQNYKSKSFQPFVKGTVGIACDHWSAKSSNSLSNTGCPSLTYGGGAGFDIPIKDGSRKAVRVEAEYFTTNFRNPDNAFRRELKNNVEVAVGLRF